MNIKERKQVVSQCPGMGIVRSWGRGGERTIILGWWTVWADANAFRMSVGRGRGSALATSIPSVLEERVTSGFQGESKSRVEGLGQSLCLFV